MELHCRFMFKDSNGRMTRSIIKKSVYLQLLRRSLQRQRNRQQLVIFFFEINIHMLFFYFIYCGFSRTGTLMVVSRLPVSTGGGIPCTFEYRNIPYVQVEPLTHRTSAENFCTVRDLNPRGLLGFTEAAAQCRLSSDYSYMYKDSFVNVL